MTYLPPFRLSPPPPPPHPWSLVPGLGIPSQVVSHPRVQGGKWGQEMQLQPRERQTETEEDYGIRGPGEGGKSPQACLLWGRARVFGNISAGSLVATQLQWAHHQMKPGSSGVLWTFTVSASTFSTVVDIALLRAKGTNLVIL